MRTLGIYHMDCLSDDNLKGCKVLEYTLDPYVIQQKNCKLMSVVGSLFVELCALDHFYLLDNNQYLVYFLFWSLATCCVH